MPGDKKGEEQVKVAKDEKRKNTSNVINKTDGAPLILHENPEKTLWGNKRKLLLAKEGRAIADTPTSLSPNTNLDETFLSCLNKDNDNDNDSEGFVVRLAAAIKENPQLAQLLKVDGGEQQLLRFVRDKAGLLQGIVKTMKAIDEVERNIEKQINTLQQKNMDAIVFDKTVRTFIAKDENKHAKNSATIEDLQKQLTKHQDNNNVKQLFLISSILKKLIQEPTSPPKHNKPH